MPQSELNMAEVLLVLTNCPDEAVAARIGRALVENRLAACVNQLPPVHSTYRWQGTVESAVEVPLLIKCTRERYPALEEAIRQLHPYATPEIVALPVVAGFAPYLRWVDDETQPPRMA
ncbi:MAG: divalent-cation tolerance protein CutA [Burkholderiaceae bacterium]|jgi:periplasmic divalent cation tolerance protein|nr:divalent-cation tolerance protein CutA [Burkholderiaceae bacterium]